VCRLVVADASVLELMERTWQALSVDQSQLGRISFGRLLRQTNGVCHIACRVRTIHKKNWTGLISVTLSPRPAESVPDPVVTNGSEMCHVLYS